MFSSSLERRQYRAFERERERKEEIIIIIIPLWTRHDSLFLYIRVLIGLVRGDARIPVAMQQKTNPMMKSVRIRQNPLFLLSLCLPLICLTFKCATRQP